MSAVERKRDPELSAVLAILGAVSLIGGVYCLAALSGVFSPMPLPEGNLLLYAAWFAVCAVSVYGIFHWKRWAVYGLAFMTLLVTLVDVTQGRATLGGASLGLLVGLLLGVYLRPIWRWFD